MRIPIARVTVLLAAAGLARFSFADVPPEGQTPSPPPNAATQSELRLWAQMYWSWLETGQVPDWAADFDFTHPEQIGADFPFFADAYDLFEEIYRHRLNLDYRTPTYYPIEQLILDDAEVFEAFKQYTTAGKLTTSVSTDAVALHTHLLLIAEAINGSPDTEVTYFVVDNGVLVSDLLIRTAPSVNLGKLLPDQPSPAPESGHEIPKRVRDGIRDSNIPAKWRELREEDVLRRWRWSPGAPALTATISRT